MMIKGYQLYVVLEDVHYFFQIVWVGKRKRKEDVIVIELRLFHFGYIQQLRKLERHKGEKVIVKKL